MFPGGWGMKFKFFRFFLNFLDLKRSKNDQVYIQMVKFEFKRTNQEATPHYRPLTPAMDGSAGGSARPGFNAGATARSGQTIGLTPALTST
jgi:hypothetical protein